MGANGNIIGADPMLTPLADNGGATWTHALQSDSLAVDWIPMGTNGCGTTYTIDQRSESRPYGPACDIGSYEASYVPTCFVETTGDDVTDFFSLNGSAVQTAVNAAAPNSLIKVAGICAGVQTQNNFTQTAYISQSLTLQGGYTHTNWLVTPNPETHPTILDAEGNGRVVYIPNNNYQVALDGLTLQNGYHSGRGGGIRARGTLTVTNSIIQNNSAAVDGGGIRARDALTVTNSIIQNNSAGGDGGGIDIGANSVAYIGNSMIRHNSIPTPTLSFGGGIHSQLSVITIKNSTIYSNTGRNGAGIATIRDLMTVENSTIYDNMASNQAGGINHQSGTVYLINSTISQNNGSYGAGILNISFNSSFSATLVCHIPLSLVTQTMESKTWTMPLSLLLTHLS